MLFDEGEVIASLGCSRESCIAQMKESLQTMEKDKTIDPKSYAMYQWFSNTYPNRGFYTGSQITSGLQEALLKEGLLQETEISNFAAVADFFILYLLSKAHLCEVLLDKSSDGYFSIGVDLDDNLVLNITFPTVPARVSVLLITTELSVKQCVRNDSMPDEAVVAMDRSRSSILKEMSWTGPLEFVEGKLVKLS